MGTCPIAGNMPRLILFDRNFTADQPVFPLSIGSCYEKCSDLRKCIPAVLAAESAIPDHNNTLGAYIIGPVSHTIPESEHCAGDNCSRNNQTRSVWRTNHSDSAQSNEHK